VEFIKPLGSFDQNAVNRFCPELATGDGVPPVWIGAACRQIDTAPEMKPERADFEINQRRYAPSNKDNARPRLA